MTQLEKNVIFAQTKHVGCEVNNVLRKVKKAEDVQKYIDQVSDAYGLPHMSMEDVVKTYDGILEKTVLQRDIVTYSGVHEIHSGTKVLDFDEIIPGTILEDVGYRSSSLVKEYEYGGTVHTGQIGNYPYVLEITTPKGHSAAYIESESGLSGYSFQEVIHPRGAKLEITSLPYFDSNSGRYIVPCKVIN